MAFTFETAGVNAAANALAAAIDHVTVHSADPAGTGGSRSDTGAVAVTCTNTNGSITLDATAVVSGAANAGATFVGLWQGDPDAGGTFLASGTLTGDQTFNAAGEYDVTGVTITVG